MKSAAMSLAYCPSVRIKFVCDEYPNRGVESSPARGKTGGTPQVHAAGTLYGQAHD